MNLMKPLELAEIKSEPRNEQVLTALIKLSPAVEFAQQLESLRASGARDLLDTMSEGEENPWLERPVKLGNQPFLMRLTEAGNDSASSFVRLRLQSEDSADELPTEAHLYQALKLASQRFWWELDMEAVRETLSVNDYGQELLVRYWPTRPANMAGPWEGLLKTVISVQIFPGLATRLQQALIEFYSDEIAHFSGKQYRFYPSVERLAEIMPEDLLGMRFSRQKARYVPAIAQMLLDQPERYDWERLRSLPGPEAVALLDELPGVGPWTSHYVAMRGLPHPDVFIDEAGLRKLLATGFGGRPQLSAEEAAKLTAVYAPYRSIACYYSYMKMYSA